MKTILRNFLYAFLICFATACSGAKDELSNYTPETLPNPKAADARNHICDPYNILTPYDKSEIQANCDTALYKSGVEMAVVVLSQIGEGQDLFMFGVDVFNKWGIGDKEKNNGVLVILNTDMQNREVRIVTGRGIEGTLTDMLCGKILDNALWAMQVTGADNYGVLLKTATNDIVQAIADPAAVEKRLDSDLVVQMEQLKDKMYLILYIVGGVVIVLLILKRLGGRTGRIAGKILGIVFWIFISILSRAGSGGRRGGGSFGGGSSGGGGASRRF